MNARSDRALARAAAALMIAGLCFACGDDGLHFKVAGDAGACSAASSGGRPAAPALLDQHDSVDGSRTRSESDTGSGAVSADSEPRSGAGDVSGQGTNARGSTDSIGSASGSQDASGASPSEHAPLDASPDGYPTGPDQWASWCDDGASHDELCGTNVDEDCDGSVDELAGLGESCVPTDVRDGCGLHAKLVCTAGTATLRCVSAACEGDGASIEVGCGNGIVEAGEQCDPATEGETVNETCTRDCRFPLFTRCVFSGRSSDEVCDPATECSTWVGACMPTVGNGKRCPELIVEHDPTVATQAVYPMVETEDKQCWVSCRDSSQCPSSLSHCYQGFCVVAF